MAPLPEADSQEPLPHPGALYERWDNVPGSSFHDFRLSPEFQGKPALTGVVQGLTPPANGGPDGSVRLRASLVAPRSGAVRFGFASETNAEFWLSPTQNPFQRQKANWSKGPRWHGWHPPKPTDQNPSHSQWSPKFELSAGATYYLELWLKEGPADDQPRIQWQWMGDKEPSDIAPGHLQLFTLSPDDQRDNGLPDAWEKETGLAELPNVHAWNDADGDGISNFQEFQAETDPLDGGFSPGVLRWDLWFDIPGAYVSDLTQSRHFPQSPDQSLLLSTTSTPFLQPGNSGSRLSGFLVPESDGTYQFALSGDDSAEFWLSLDEQPAQRQLLAFCDTWRRPARFDATSAQLSPPVTLRAGQAYYLEILHKDQQAPGRLDLVWRQLNPDDPTTSAAPDDAKSLLKSLEPIPSSLLRSPRDTPESRARGNLASAWIAKYSLQSPDDPSGLTPYANPSGDGVPNWVKARDQLDPFTRYETPGGLARQWWFRSRGSSLENARRNHELLHPPHMVTITPGAATDKHTTNYFLSRARGTVAIPADATYRFWISGDDHCELWLSSTDSKFYKRLIAHVGPGPDGDPESGAWTHPLDWDKFATQRSAEITLTKGSHHFIEVLLKHGNGPDHFAVAWQYKLPNQQSWSPREVIPAGFLVAHPGDPADLDDDYLPDSWESEYGLNPSENGLGDPREGEYGDYDDDKLTNREEFLLGTNPTNPDTDGDGVFDNDEIDIYGTDPKRQDAAPPVLVASPSILAPESDDPWGFTEDDHLLAVTNYGRFSFSVTVDSPGIFLLELDAAARVSSFSPPLPVIAYLNEREVGRAQVEPPGSTHRWLTPWLDKGTHTITIADRNPRVDAMLLIRALHLYRHESADPATANPHGVPDWLLALLKRDNAITTTAHSSLVSPFSIEGIWRWENDAKAHSHDASLPLFPALTGTWFAPLDLAPDGSPTPFEVAFDSDLVTGEIAVTWAHTHPFDLDGQSLHLPVGGSLRLATALNLDGDQTNSLPLAYSLDSGPLAPDPEKSSPNSLILPFETPGVFTLTAASVSLKNEATLTIHVHSASFGKPFALRANQRDHWHLPQFSKDLFLKTDPGIYLATDLQDPQKPGRNLFVTSTQTQGGVHRVISRLPDSLNLISAGTVEVFSIVPATTTRDARHTHTLADGTRVVEIAFGLNGPVPADLELWIVLIVPDAVFANGQARIRLTAADFDENGITRLNVFKAPGEGVAYVCHNIYTDAPPPPPATE